MALGAWRLEGTCSRFSSRVYEAVEKERIDLPDLSDSQYIDAVSAVVPVNIDDDSATEIVILSTLISGAGPTASQPYPHNLVLDWDGSKFVRLVELEKKIAESTRAEDVNKKSNAPDEPLLQSLIEHNNSGH